MMMDLNVDQIQILIEDARARVDRRAQLGEISPEAMKDVDDLLGLMGGIANSLVLAIAQAELEQEEEANAEEVQYF